MFVSFTNPHDPWEIPQRFWDRYRRDDIERPGGAARSRSTRPIPTAAGCVRCARSMQAGLTAEQIRRARHGYYAAISYLDERVGQVLGALRDSGLEDRTTVLFCADHGEMLGERGLWYKMSLPRAVGPSAADRPRARVAPRAERASPGPSR